MANPGFVQRRGGGGWSLGLHRAGFTTVAACEADLWRRAVFGRNNPGVALYDDVRTLTADRLLGDLRFLPEIVCGSPPCQDASLAEGFGCGQAIMAEGLERRTGEPQGFPAVAAPMHGFEIAGRQPDRDRTEVVAAADKSESVGRRTVGGRFGRQEANAGIEIASDADEEGREGGRMEPRLRAPQEPEHRRSFLEAWAGWNGGPPEIGRVDDGIPEALASRRGLGRACLAAYGDAVVPQIAEAIGRAIMRIDARD